MQKNPGEGGLSIVIPTINSARYIDIVLGFYLRHQIPVTVLVDNRSCDETFAIAKSLVPDTRLIPQLRDWRGRYAPKHCGDVSGAMDPSHRR